MNNQNGFTLVELLVAMVIGVIVMAAAYSSYVSQQKAYLMTESVSEIQQNLRSAMIFIERDLRMAGFNPKKESGFGFSAINSSSFEFNKDSVVENGVDTDPGERVKYALDTNVIKRNNGDGNGWQVIADKISGMELTYFDRNGVETADISSVRSVFVKLTATEKGHTRELSSLIKCRNLGL